jgi:hypothetical protein
VLLLGLEEAYVEFWPLVLVEPVVEAVELVPDCVP